MTNAPQYIREHPKFDAEEYEYCRAEGWTNEQIAERWSGPRLIEILNDPDGHALVDNLEDVLSSLRAYPDGDRTLEEIRDSLIEELRRDFGFTWVL